MKGVHRDIVFGSFHAREGHTGAAMNASYIMEPKEGNNTARETEQRLFPSRDRIARGTSLENFFLTDVFKTNAGEKKVGGEQVVDDDNTAKMQHCRVRGRIFETK